MRDFIVRLASMKLAEIKFKVAVQYADSEGFWDEGEYYYSFLKDLPRTINGVLGGISLSSVNKRYMSYRNEQFFNLDFEDEEGNEVVVILIYKPKDMSDQVFLTLIKSIGLSAGEEKIRSTYRLASMKLAEMKFKVEVDENWVDDHLSFNYSVPMKKIKELVEDTFVEDYEEITVGLEDVGQYCIHQEIDFFTSKVIWISKPENISLQLFLSLLNKAGLDDKNKIKRLIK